MMIPTRGASSAMSQPAQSPAKRHSLTGGWGLGNAGFSAVLHQSPGLGVAKGRRGNAWARKLSILQIVTLDLAQRVVQLVDDRLAGRDLEAGDLVVGDVREVLDQRPQRVAV